MERSWEDDELSHRLIRAMSHPLRVRILRILTETSASPKELAKATGEAHGNVAYHARVLVQLGCAEVVETASHRNTSELFYKAKPEAFTGLSKWRAYPRIVRGEIAELAFRELYVRIGAALEARTFQRREGSNLSCLAFEVDEAGWKELREAIKVAEQAILKVSQRAANRLDAGKGIPAVISLGLFESAAGSGPSGSDQSQ